MCIQLMRSYSSTNSSEWPCDVLMSVPYGFSNGGPAGVAFAGRLVARSGVAPSHCLYSLFEKHPLRRGSDLNHGDKWDVMRDKRKRLFCVPTFLTRAPYLISNIHFSSV